MVPASSGSGVDGHDGSDDDEPPGILLDYTRDKVVVLDRTGAFRYLNAATEEILGYTPEELVGENAFNYIHPDDVEHVREVFVETVASDEEYAAATVEYRHRCADGSYVHMESRFSNVAVPSFDGYVISSRDVTDRVEAERERDETARQLSAIAGATDDVLWMFNGDWSELLFANPAYETVYGQPVEQIEGDPTAFLEAVHPEDRPRVAEAMDRLSAGEPVDIEYRVNARQNYNRWVWVQGQPIVDDGEVTRIAGFTRDVSDRRRRERQLAVIDTVLRHNLRNDLNKIVGYADETGDLEGPVSADDLDECARVIRNVGEGLLEKAEKQRTINRILTDNSGSRRLDLASVIEHAVERFEEDEPGTTATIEVDVPEGLAARTRPDLEVAVGELVENAVEHATEDSPWIRISGHRDGNEVVLTFEDHNPPIPDYDYRILTGDDEMSEVYHSSGLGLWLVYWVIDLSDGSIEFDRTDDGNLVRVRLPVADDGT
ncbi:hypothetical protein JCM17823_03560 [Halorubrum gandharaense]